MNTTFETAAGQERRREYRQRHLEMIDRISRNSIFLSFEETDFIPAVEADALSGEPLQMMTLPVDDPPLGCKLKDRRIMMISIACFILFAISLLVPVALTAVKPKEVAPTFQSSNITNSSSNGNDLNLARYREFLSMVLDWNVTSRDRLENDMDPAARALYWLAFTERENETIEALRTRYSLATLYFSTRGKGRTSSWNQESHWMSSDPVCTWYGIECTTFPGEPRDPEIVRTLNLSANALDGTIPREIALLQLGLRSLDLSSNLLGGSIPNVEALKNLRKLVLSHNYLTSSIPDALYQLSHLLHLKLNDCLLTGTLSSEISTLSQLRGLELQNNILNGSIPETLDRMSGLRLLYLDGNELSGTIPMALPGRVVDLRLSRNQLNGPIPSEIANSRRLRVLHLYSNGLTGSLPSAAFGSLALLEEIQIHNNRLSGRLPQEMFELSILQVLYADGNLLTGPIPDIGSATDLGSIYLFRNLLTGTIPRSFGNLSYLADLQLNDNDLTGRIPTEVGIMSSLEVLHVNNNTFLDGTIPAELRSLSHLASGHFHGNRFRGSMPLCDPSAASALVSLTSDCSELMQCSCCTECFA